MECTAEQPRERVLQSAFSSSMKLINVCYWNINFVTGIRRERNSLKRVSARTKTVILFHQRYSSTCTSIYVHMPIKYSSALVLIATKQVRELHGHVKKRVCGWTTTQELSANARTKHTFRASWFQVERATTKHTQTYIRTLWYCLQTSRAEIANNPTAQMQTNGPSKKKRVPTCRIQKQWSKKMRTFQLQDHAQFPKGVEPFLGKHVHE